MNQLLQDLQTNGLVIGNYILLKDYAENHLHKVDIDIFKSFFEETMNDDAKPDKYQALKDADQGKGYILTFDLWNGMGII